VIGGGHIRDVGFDLDPRNEDALLHVVVVVNARREQLGVPT
jgi:hypothetical protein